MSEKTLEFNLTVANDNGNSMHDIIINGDYISQPNVYSKVTKLHDLSEVSVEHTLNDLENRLIVSILSDSCPVGTYFIGNQAFKSKTRITDIEVGLDNSKLESPVPVINTLAQIAAYATKQAYKEDPTLKSDIKVVVDMATALPVTQYSKSNGIKFAKRFKGNHNVKVYVGPLTSNVEIKFDFVRTLPEGVTAIHAFDYLSKNDKEFFKEFEDKYNVKITDKFFKNEKHSVLHVAIGEGTTETPITTGRAFDPQQIEGSKHGMGNVLDASLADYMSIIHTARCTRQQFANAVNDPSNPNHQFALEAIEPFLEPEAEDIVKDVKKILQNEEANGGISMLCCYGGGSINMEPVLKPQLEAACEKHRTQLLYVPKEMARKLEALGLYAFIQLPAFKELKKRVKETEFDAD